MSTPRATPVIDQQLTAAPLVPWQLVVWDDPVNLMSYVARIFRTYFGYPKEKAERLMLAVHNEGHAIVATGPRETMEMHAQAMHGFGLWATVRRADQ
ncbi:ATP-dependent Clp protease adapter ClpS [Microbacterium sp.]|jgi:ATP-dependent Clp protease adaptor protein ClpS|uniref:ATP-dependent Clp protease adapter ClpS n=1 Tax=Microbacterium sp. TaxID=51671 RepID=UPI00261C0291|nr:ATP-dependent Clp protease adapter ClpS [uncultured Microbacterium sp.]